MILEAARLRALTVGRVLARSPVVFQDEQGNRFEYTGHAIAQERAKDKDGKEKGKALPVLTLVIRPVQSPAVEAAASDPHPPPVAAVAAA